MCLAIPGKVLDIEPGSDPVMGKAGFGGIQKKVCLDWVPGVRVGDYVIVHVGFAISRMDEAEALKTLELFRELTPEKLQENSGEEATREKNTREENPQ